MFVLKPVAMGKDKLIPPRLAHRGNRAYRAPRLGALNAIPGLHRLRQLEALRLGVGDAQEYRRLAVAEAAKLARLDLNHRRIKVGQNRGLRVLESEPLVEREAT